MSNQIKSDIKAFNMFGNLYFVGSSRVCVHIIKTEKGLVMIDTGYPDMYEQILDSMAEFGFKPEDICAIFHSHGHIDHFGATERLKALSGAKTYVGRIDNDILNGTYDLSWAKELGLERMPFFNCDILVDDGDVFVFGKTKIKALHTPGHTQGTMSYFVNVEDGKNSIIAGMHGGVGMNSLSRKFLTDYNLPLELRDEFRKGLHRLANEHVDLHMGNHAGHNDTQGKCERVLAGESIVNPDDWSEFLVRTEKRLDDLLEKEQQELNQ